MASFRNWVREQQSNLGCSIVAFQMVIVLVLLVVTFISVANWAGDGGGSGWNDGAVAVSRRNDVDRISEFQASLGPRFGRGLLQIAETDSSSTNDRPLAVKRGRFDPFNDFHKYRGGYDVKSKHYWGVLSFHNSFDSSSRVFNFAGLKIKNQQAVDFLHLVCSPSRQAQYLVLRWACQSSNENSTISAWHEQGMWPVAYCTSPIEVAYVKEVAHIVWTVECQLVAPLVAYRRNQSLVWTGLPGYAIAVAWLVLGISLLLSVCCSRCWCRRKRPTHLSDVRPTVLYLWVTISVAALLTMAAICGCVVLFVGSREFAGEARKVEHAFKDAAANATGTIDGLTGAINDVEQILEPFRGSASIITGGISLNTLNSTQETLSRESENINHTVHKNTRTLDQIITALEIALVVVAGLNLILIIVGPVFVMLHWKRSFYLMVTMTWILTALTAVLFGVSFVLDNLVKDTCNAMNEYRADPYNTTLDALLPCQDLMSASGALADIGQGIRDSISQVNTTIIQFEVQLNASLPVLCEQIGPAPSYQYISTCPAGTIPISELPQVLQSFRCTTNDSQTCSQQGKPLTDFQYTEVVAYSRGAGILLNVYPSISGLANCSIVVQTFNKLLARNCGPTKAAARLVWDAFIILTISLILLILWWLVLTCGNRERKEQIFPVVGSPVKNKLEK